MAFSPEFLDELRSRLTLSEVVGRRVALKRKGREHSGLCPFHNEKTPSFTLNDQKGFFHCFGCGAHGDVVGFVMRSEGLSFPEAVERLAREAGLALPVASPAERQREQQAASLHEVVEKATRWFERQLWSAAGAEALDYLRRRGLSDDTIRGFRLGYAPDEREALRKALAADNCPEPLLVEAGLLIKPEDGRSPYDRFRGRAMFPIEDRRGRIIAFGGRIMGAGEPKYLNSPETPLFHKGTNLFAYARARPAVHENAPLVVAEGYMDVIALHQAGFQGAVAPLGTALTEEQIGLLWRLADEPFLCFDGDNAGSRAAARGAERALPLLKPGKSLRFVSLPPGEDPDSLIRAQGPQAFRTALDNALPLAEIVWRLEIDGKQLDTPERRAAVEAALMRRAGLIADAAVQFQYRNEWRERLRKIFRPAPPARFGRADRRADRRFNTPPPLPAGHKLVAPEGLSERSLLAILLRQPRLIPMVAEELAHLNVADPGQRRLVEALLGWAGQPESHIPQETAAGGTPVENTGFDAYLQGLGLEALVRHLLAKFPARLAGEEEAQVEAWREAAATHNAPQQQEAALQEAMRAWEESPTEENWQRLKALKQQVFDAQTQFSRFA